MRKVVGWTLLLTPFGVSSAAFYALTVAKAGGWSWAAVGGLLITGLVAVAAVSGMIAIMNAGMRMIEAEKEGEE